METLGKPDFRLWENFWPKNEKIDFCRCGHFQRAQRARLGLLGTSKPFFGVCGGYGVENRKIDFLKKSWASTYKARKPVFEGSSLVPSEKAIGLKIDMRPS